MSAPVRAVHVGGGYCDTRKPVRLCDPCPECGEAIEAARVLDEPEPMTLRATIAGLRAVRARMTPGPWRTTVSDGDDGLVAEGFEIGRLNWPTNAIGIVATHNATPALLDALDRIAAVVDGVPNAVTVSPGQVIAAFVEIRAILDGARGGCG